MTTGTVSHLERSIHKTNQWINDIKNDLGMDGDNAYIALKATLHMLRDRLTVEEATDLAAQLPIVLKGIYYDGWNPSKNPEKMDKVTFVSRVHFFFNNDPSIDPEKVVHAVFNILEKRIGEGEMDDIRANLPPDIAEMYNQAIAA